MSVELKLMQLKIIWHNHRRNVIVCIRKKWN